MKPVLLEYTVITPLALLIIFAVLLLGIALWLGILAYLHRYTRDHLLTGLVLAGMSALFLVIIHQIGHFRINAYGAMLILGFLIGVFSATRLGIRRGIPAERILDLALLILVAAILGARLLYMALTTDAGPLFNVQEIMRSGLGGLSFHGGLLGGILVTIVYARVMKLPFWRLADAMIPSVAVGYAITRIGCFLNGCCYGRPTDLPWAVTFPASAASGHVASVHPTQLYASVMMFAAYALLLWLSRGESLRRAGRLFMVFLFAAGVERFVMEIFREPDAHFQGLLTPAQWFSLAIVLAGIAGWFLLPAQPAIPPSPSSRVPAQPLHRREK